MAGQKQVTKTGSKEEAEVTDLAPADSKKGEDLKADIDDLLDDIDEVLEVNAEDFVRSYVQKGGQ